VNVLLDTNVLIAAFASQGTCADLFEHCARRHTLITSEAILAEFKSAGMATLGFSRQDADHAAALIRARARIVVPARIPAEACRDPNDLHILGAAVAGDCQCLLTGDRDLLTLKRYATIPIISPSEFWRYEQRQQGSL
jgi:putative PIN family toxin of toxin-antitoxin system